MSEIVPLTDPKAENALFRQALVDAMTRVVDSGFYILGPNVSAFEERLARSVGAVGAIGVGTGTDAIALSLQALDIGVGDEVIAPSHTAGPTIAAIHMTGATPVLVDIEPETYCVSPQAVEQALSPRSRAIIAVHLYGHPANLDELQRIARVHNVALIEDCAQAQGASYQGRKVGGIGDIGCFSFYPTKALGALGDGGGIASGRADLIDRVKWLRTYGWKRPQYAEVDHGRCSRLDELQSAVLLVKLDALDEMNQRRQRIAAAYAEGLRDSPLALPTTRASCTHVFHLYVVRSAQRDALETWLAAKGVKTGRHYPFPTHVQPALVKGSRISGTMVETDKAAAEILSLPMFATMTPAQVERVVDAIRSFPGP